MIRAVAEKRQLFKLARRERIDPIPFHERTAADAMKLLRPSLDGRLVLDLGCGPGHSTRALRSRGATVVPVDLSAVEFAGPGGPPGHQLIADGQRLPFRDGCFDGVYTSNMLEHVPDPRRALAEMTRVIRPDGWLWLSWTNWFSPWGGHDIAPFHYLGVRLGVAAHRRLRGWEPKNVPGESLFPLHIGTVLAIIQKSPDLELSDVRPRYYPSQAWILRVPGLRELATWNCVLEATRT